MFARDPTERAGPFENLIGEIRSSQRGELICAIERGWIEQFFRSLSRWARAAVVPFPSQHVAAAGSERAELIAKDMAGYHLDRHAAPLHRVYEHTGHFAIVLVDGEAYQSGLGAGFFKEAPPNPR